MIKNPMQLRLKKALPKDIKEGVAIWYKEEDKRGNPVMRSAKVIGLTRKSSVQSYAGYPTYISENGTLSASCGAYVAGDLTIADRKEWAARWYRKAKRNLHNKIRTWLYLEGSIRG